MQLTNQDRKRWAELLLWLKKDRQLSNEELGKILSCANSTISAWTREKRSELHDDKIQKMASYLKLSEVDLLLLITKEVDLPIAQRIESIRSSQSNNYLPDTGSTSLNLEEILEAIRFIPTWELPKIIELAIARLNNSFTREPRMLSQQERIQISKLVFVSAQEMKDQGKEKELKSFLQKTPFLSEILSAQKSDFILGITEGHCSIQEPVQKAIVDFCYQVAWKNKDPIIIKPLRKYNSFAQIIRGLSEDDSGALSVPSSLSTVK
jgi:transcriptional regulator with XRE-family HTH domain